MSDAREALARVTAWLDDDSNLRIPDTPWGRTLYDDLRLIAAGWTPPTVEGEQLGCTGAGDCPATAHTHGCYADTEGHCEHTEEHGWTPPTVKPSVEDVARRHSRVSMDGTCICGAVGIGFVLGYGEHLVAETLALLEKGAGERPGEEWPGGDPAACGCGNPDAHRPAPAVPDSPHGMWCPPGCGHDRSEAAVPDSTDVRERVREVIRLSKIADPAWVSERTFDEFDALVEEVTDAVLAVVGQGVTAVDCNCGFGGQHDPANPRCRANRAVLALLPGRTETEVKVEALREAAETLRDDDMGHDRWYADWLEYRAARIKKEADRD